MEAVHRLLKRRPPPLSLTGSSEDLSRPSENLSVLSRRDEDDSDEARPTRGSSTLITIQRQTTSPARTVTSENSLALIIPSGTTSSPSAILNTEPAQTLTSGEQPEESSRDPDERPSTPTTNSTPAIATHPTTTTVTASSPSKTTFASSIIQRTTTTEALTVITGSAFNSATAAPAEVSATLGTAPAISTAGNSLQPTIPPKAEKALVAIGVIAGISTAAAIALLFWRYSRKRSMKLYKV